jgi:preprotein translocase subunit SecG
MSVILLIAAILLILAVLIQPSKSGGLGSAGFGGVSGQFSNMFGVRRTTDFLQKFTIGIALAILLLVVITNKFFLDTGSASQGERVPVTVGAEKPVFPQQQSQQQQAPAQNQQQAQPQQGQQQAPAQTPAGQQQ